MCWTFEQLHNVVAEAGLLLSQVGASVHPCTSANLEPEANTHMWHTPPLKVT